MRLSRFTDLGLRALMYLGSEGERASAARIAGAFDVSKDHMMKSLQALAKAGMVDATVGRNGGFSLAGDPSCMRLGDVVRTLEPHMDMAECFTSDSRCPLTPSCGLTAALRDAREDFLRSLDRHTLADLVNRTRPRLVALNHG